MGGNRVRDYTRRIRELDQSRKVFIRKDHIERDRIYREITLEHARRALATGQVTEVRTSDSSVLWQGRDEDGRLLELNCTLKDDEGDVTLVIVDVHSVVVGTAYEPGTDDEALRKIWLASHPEYEDAGKRKGVQKKLVVSKV